MEQDVTEKRVVVTGMGLVCPLGRGVSYVWGKLIQGASGIRGIEHFDVSKMASKVAGMVPCGTEKGQLDMDGLFSLPDKKKNDTFILYAMAASDDALADAGWRPENDTQRERTGVLIGSGIGGLPRIYDTSVALYTKGARGVSPFFISASLINLASGQVSIRHGLRGPNEAITTACASSNHAIGAGAQMIRQGKADVMLVGGTEGAVCPIGVAGFASMKALSSNFNDCPTEASRPWDKDRDGFVIADGAGLLVLEDYEHAKARGATLYGELLGYGLSGDAYHVSAPSTDGPCRSMNMAFKDAGVSLDQVGYVNAHGTSTPLGDKNELEAIHQVFGGYTKNLCVSSTKSATGHLLGGAGGIEAIFLLCALREGCLPPTLNLHNPSVETDIDLVPLKAKEVQCHYGLSNSFGFGGTNASLIFKSPRCL